MENFIDYIRKLEDLGEAERLLNELTKAVTRLSFKPNDISHKDLSTEAFKVKNRPNLFDFYSDDEFKSVLDDMLLYLKQGTFSGSYFRFQKPGEPDVIFNVVKDFATYFTGSVKDSKISPRKGIFLYGHSGSGKTHTMSNLLTYANTNLGFKYPLVRIDENYLNQFFNQRDVVGRFSKVFPVSVDNELVQVDFSADVFMDDLFRTPSLTENASKFLYSRFEEFEKNGALTFVTSNLKTDSALRESMDPHLFSRMTQMFNFIPMNVGYDFRKK